MADCKRCLEKDPPVKTLALYVKNGVPLCAACNMQTTVNRVAASVEKREEKKMPVEEKCYCGRKKGHTGRHVGSPAKLGDKPKKAKVARSFPKRAARHLRESLPPKKDLGGSVIGAIVELETKRDKIQRLIDELKSL